MSTPIKDSLQRAYVYLMMDIIGRGLVTSSQVDPVIQAEAQGFPQNYTLCMTIFPHGPQFVLKVNQQQQFELCPNFQGKADLTITFKHIKHAFLVFSFQESTAQAFANDRMIADGEIAHAIRLVRCLNQMEALILPKAIARLAVKAYPQQLGLKEKISSATQIYLKVVQSYLKWSK